MSWKGIGHEVGGREVSGHEVGDEKNGVETRSANYLRVDLQAGILLYTSLLSLWRLATLSEARRLVLRRCLLRTNDQKSEYMFILILGVR